MATGYDHWLGSSYLTAKFITIMKNMNANEHNDVNNKTTTKDLIPVRIKSKSLQNN